MLQLMHEGCSYTYPPLYIARYSFIQPSELEQCRVKKIAQRFNIAAQDLKPGSRSRESKALPLSHYALINLYISSGSFPTTRTRWRCSTNCHLVIMPSIFEVSRHCNQRTLDTGRINLVIPTKTIAVSSSDNLGGIYLNH